MAAARALLLLLLLLLAPPDSSAAPGSSAADAFALFLVKHGKKVVEAISTIREETTKYIKENNKPGVKDISGARYNGNGDDHQLGSSAADSYGALIFNLSVGTSASPQVLPFVMDITSKLVWAQCGGPAEAPTFLPNGSNSFTPIGCADKKCKSLIPKYKCTDPDDHCGGTSAYLATETFNFDTTPIPGVVFGCLGMVMARRLQVQKGASGSAGFSRGPLSLVSQLNISSFSYFIDDSGNDKSFVSFGDADDTPPAKGSHSHSTPLLPPSKGQNPDLYYVKLTGVQVDGELLADIPEGTFDVRADGSGGVFLSTTLPLTYLDKAAHKVLRQKLASRILSQRVVGLPVNAADKDTLCFPTKDFANVKVPRVALVFDGDDAAMELNVKNYFFDVSGGHTCLSILPSTGGSVLGSLLQMGRNMTYDIHGDGGGLLTFELAATSAPAAAAAGAPAPAQVSLVIIAALLGWVLLF